MKTEAEMKAHLLEKAEADSAFRAELLADPKAVVEKEFDVTVPDGFAMHVHEDTATSAHLVLPPSGGRLNPSELQAVAGGTHLGPEHGQTSIEDW